MKTCTASRFYMHVSLMYPYLSWFSYLSMTYWAIQCACAPRKVLSTDWLGISPYLACISIILQYLYHSCRMVQFGRVWDMTDMTDMTGRWQEDDSHDSRSPPSGASEPSVKTRKGQDAGQQQHSLGDATPRRMVGSQWISAAQVLEPRLKDWPPGSTQHPGTQQTSETWHKHDINMA